MTEQELKNKRVAMIGLGVEGVPMLEFLQGKVASLTILNQHDKEKSIAEAAPELRKRIERLLSDEKISQVMGPDYLDNLSNYDVVFRTPGLSYNNSAIQTALKAGVEISSQIKLFFDLCPATIIGVSGTKGKGTTSSLIYEIIKKQVESGKWKGQKKVYIAGNIGLPAISLIPELKREDFVVLELSSFQLMDMEKSPQIAVITNLAVEHQDYHGSVEEYERAKFNILAHQSPEDYAVLNAYSTFKAEWIGDLQSEIRYSGKSGEKPVYASVVEQNGVGRVVLDPEERNISIVAADELKLIGTHNLENIAAAAIVADILGVSVETIAEATREFGGLPHRLEHVAEVAGVEYIDDSFATTLGPTLAAINSIRKNKILILGGSSKGADFSELAEKIAETPSVTGIVLIGEEASKISAALLAANYSGTIKDGGSTIEEIVENAKSLAHSGDAVIMSPACASFGLFKNYKDRGEKFQAAVSSLSSK